MVEEDPPFPPATAAPSPPLPAATTSPVVPPPTPALAPGGWPLAAVWPLVEGAWAAAVSPWASERRKASTGTPGAGGWAAEVALAGPPMSGAIHPVSSWRRRWDLRVRNDGMCLCDIGNIQRRWQVPRPCRAQVPVGLDSSAAAVLNASCTASHMRWNRLRYGDHGRCTSQASMPPVLLRQPLTLFHRSQGHILYSTIQ